MSLTNAQYEEIMRSYNLKQLKTQRELDERRKEVYRRIPQMHTLDELSGSIGLSCARALLEENPVSDSLPGADTPEPSDAKRLASFRAQMKRITRERMRLLLENDYPEDYLEPVYSCADCQDTGFVQGKMCHCFQKAVTDLYYTQSGLAKAVQAENFDTFRLDYYPRDTLLPTGKSVRAHMQEVLRICRDFPEHFRDDHRNLLFYGETGLGKTFLSHCIAGKLLENGFSVIYYSAEGLFRAMGNAMFNRTESSDWPENRPESIELSLLFDCDLLIIDDLGTELTNNFVASQLFRLLNERMSAGKSILISTNLSLAQMSSLYSERIMSRITSGFTLLAFYGSDIRILKKLQAPSS